MSRALCVSCTTDAHPLDVRGLCRQCRAAYALGRQEVLEEVRASAERVRGPVRSGRGHDEYRDEHEDGSYAAARAILVFVSRLTRRKYPRAKK